MKNHINYVQISLNKNSDFISELRQGITSCYESVPQIHIKNKFREVKIIPLEDKLYVLEKTEHSIGVYSIEIQSFDTDRSLKYLTKYAHFDSEEIFLPVVVLVSLIDSVKLTNDEFIKYFEANDASKLKQARDVIEGLKSIGFTSDYSMSNYYDEKNNSNTSPMPHNIRDFCNYLVKNQFMKANRDDNFYRSLMNKGNVEQDIKIPDYRAKIEYFVKVCLENKFTFTNPFGFNDGDYHVFLNQNNLVVTDQNCGFYFEIKDHDNITVYFLDKEFKNIKNEINRTINGIGDGTIDKLKYIVWEIKDGKTVFFNSVSMYVLDSNFQYGVIAMEKNGLGAVSYNKDIFSYQYQKDYYYTKFGYTEFQFLAQAFLTLSGGFQYDKKNGRFVDKGVKYLSKINTEKERQTQRYNNMNYCYPNEFSYLNQDWRNGLEYLVKVLEYDRPTPVVYKGDSDGEAIDNAIDYFKLKLDKL